MLKTQDLHAYYGPIEALKGIDITVKEGQIACLIGSNGAGKTTLLNAISGMIKTTGSISWANRELTKMSCTQIAKFGIMHVPSGRHVFPGLTVRENLEVGTINWRGPFGAPKFKEDLETVYALFPRLKERRTQVSGTLSGGEQQMLAMGRALMSEPKLLMLDEPSMGLAPLLVEQIFEIIKSLHKAGSTILLVEQNAQMALQVADRAYVLESGRITLSGTGAELMASESVKRAYLGG